MSSPLDVAIEKSGIEASRVRRLNELDARATVTEYNAAGYDGDQYGSKYVLYFTSDCFRTQNNEALELSKALANELELPLIVLAVVDLRSFLKGSARHVRFVLEGIAEFEEALLEQGIGVCVRVEPAKEVGGLSVIGDASQNITGFASKSWAVVTDRPHLAENIETVSRVASEAGCSVIDVETHVLIPVEDMFTECVRDRNLFEERFLSLCPDYAKLLPVQDVNVTASEELMDEVDKFGLIFDFMQESEDEETWGAPDWLNNVGVLYKVLEQSNIRTDIPKVPYAGSKGGEGAARKLLSTFIARKLKGYARAWEVNQENNRSEYGSLLAPYFCYGFISSSEVASKIVNSGRALQDNTAFLRSLARREMAFNLVNTVPEYSNFNAVVKEDARERLIKAGLSRKKLDIPEGSYERGQTPNNHWNNLHQEMVKLGRDLSMDRALWIQLLFEMEPDPMVAFDRAVRLSSLFMLDSLDPVVYHCVAEYATIISTSSHPVSPSEAASEQAAPVRDVQDAAKVRQIESNLWNAMKVSGVEESRIRRLNGCGVNPDGKYVLYWAQTAFRTTHNDSLEIAKSLAVRANLPLLVLDVISLDSWKSASKRHLVFHIEGVVELEEQIQLDGAAFQFRVEPCGKSGVSILGDPKLGIQGFASSAWLIVTDRPHMKMHREITTRVAESVNVAVIDVESKLLMPLEFLANPETKVEPDFSVFFDRFMANIKKFAKGLTPQEVSLAPCTNLSLHTLGYRWPCEPREKVWSAKDWLQMENDRDTIFKEAGIDVDVPVVTTAFKGGESTAKRLLTTFLSRVLFGYGRASEVHGEMNRKEYGSLLSPYLCHGFISPAEIAISVLRSGKNNDDTAAYLRNICKREHAFNKIYFDPDYDVYEKAISKESRAVLSKSPFKKYQYTDLEWERGLTHDQRWNTVQHELFFKGRDILQDRRYWAQKLIEYETDPANSFRLMCHLNDKYMLDAGDPCSYYNILLCFEQAKSSMECTAATEDASAILQILEEEIARTKIPANKVRQVNELGPRPPTEKGGSAQYVLYYAKRACRQQNNESLELAKALSNRSGLPLIYLYVIDLHFYRKGSKRHINFLLEGLAELKNALSDSGIKLVVRIDPVRFGERGEGGISVIGDEAEQINGFANHAWAIVMDRAHLDYEKEVAARIAAYAGCSVVDVESRLIMPVEDVYDGPANNFDDFYQSFQANSKPYMVTPAPAAVKYQIFSDLDLESLGYRWDFMTSWHWGPREWLDNDGQFSKVLASNGVDPNVSVATGAYRGGESPARRLLQSFLQRKLNGFASRVEDESEIVRREYTTVLSPYLAYGMISVVEVAMEVSRAGSSMQDIEAFLKVLAKREYAFNMVNYFPAYGKFETDIPAEYQESLSRYNRHQKFSYTDEQWAKGETHDSKWNAIQHELVFRGKDFVFDMQYWCQRIFEYENDPAKAYHLAVTLNDKFMLDGLDPVCYRIIQECFIHIVTSVVHKEVAVQDSSIMRAVLDQILPETGVDPERVHLVNDFSHRHTPENGGTGEYILYWMSSAPRKETNPAFEIAKALSNHADLPLLVLFVVDLNHYHHFSKRHILFLLEGLSEVEQSVTSAGAGFRLVFEPKSQDGIGGLNLLGSDDGSVSGFIQKAWAMVCDKVYMRGDRERAERVFSAAGCSVIEVETKLVVPLDVSLGENARAFPSTEQFLTQFDSLCPHFVKNMNAVPLDNRMGVELNTQSIGFCFDEDGLTATWSTKTWLENKDVIDSLLEINDIDINVPDVAHSLKGGYRSAKKLVSLFITKKLRGYATKLAQEGDRLRAEYGSLLSTYLATGFISPVEVLLECTKAAPTEEDLKAFMRSLGRRELAYAYVYFHRDIYDKYESISENVRSKLIQEARSRPVKYKYTREEWEKAETHDEKWNSVQKELIFRGRDIAQDRSFWCFKLIEFEQDPKNAYELAMYLNDRYMLDADAIGFLNVKECFEKIANIGEAAITATEQVVNHILADALHDACVKKEFVRPLNDKPFPGSGQGLYILYWATTAFRRRNNPSLQLAMALANRMRLPLVVLTALSLERYHTASRRHVVFLLEGLQELHSNLSDIGIAVAFRIDPSSVVHPEGPGVSVLGSKALGVEGFAKNAMAIVTDRDVLRHGVQLEQKVAKAVNCPVFDVESKLIVPIELVSDHVENDFHDFHSSFVPLVPKYATTYPTLNMEVTMEALGSEANLDNRGYFFENLKLFKARDFLDNQDLLSKILTANNIPASVSTVSGTYRGGEGAARRLLNIFLAKKLKTYSQNQEMYGERARSEYGSLLSPYLTNGFIAASEIVVELEKIAPDSPDTQAFIKSFARREQAFNFVRYTEKYDDFDTVVPQPVQIELKKTVGQLKKYEYSDEDWDQGETHDSRWNTVQHELRFRGRDIAQDRFFWCLKLIEYEKDPRNAYRLALKFNDKYMVDALDAVGFKNIADCFRVASSVGTAKATAVNDPNFMESLLPTIVSETNVHPSRVRILNTLGPRPSVADGGMSQYVLYWATSGCRRSHNESLEVAKALANHAQLPLVVIFVVDLNVLKIGSKRHVVFLLEGLAELYSGLADIGVKLCIRFEPPEEYGGKCAASIIGNDELSIRGFASHAWAVVTDRAHLRYARKACAEVIEKAGCAVIDVESRLVVPIEEAHVGDAKKWLDSFPTICAEFTKKLNVITPAVEAGPELEMVHLGWRWDFTASDEWSPKDWLNNDATLTSVLKANGFDTDVPPVSGTYLGGEGAARRLLNIFVAKKLRGYGDEVGLHGDNNRSEYGSLLSPYLCNGFISSAEICAEIIRSGRSEHDSNTYLRNLGRRELAFHFVNQVPDGYDKYESAVPMEVQLKLTELAKHRKYYQYTDQEWEKGETHDKKWNSVQHELIFRGRDIAQDRFYWLYKIIEYENDPKNAYYLAMSLNDKYMVDAMDAVGYRNVADGFILFCEIEEGKSRRTENRTRESAFKDTIVRCIEPTGVEESRVRVINQKGSPDKVSDGGQGEYVLYFCSSAFRVGHNESLEIAKALANDAELPLLVLCVLDINKYVNASYRHIHFLMQGLSEFEQGLKSRNIGFEFRIEPTNAPPGLSVLGDPQLNVEGFGSRAWAIVVDRGYLRRARDVESRIAREALCPVVEVETSLLVPLEVSAEVMEDTVDAFFYRFFPLSNQFIKTIPEGLIKIPSNVLDQSQLAKMGSFVPKFYESPFSPQVFLDDESLLSSMSKSFKLPIVTAVNIFVGGESNARQLLTHFVTKSLPGYSHASELDTDSQRAEYGSFLSSYLSSGFISVVEIAVEVLHSTASDADIIAFLRNLCRRELAYNFAYHTQDYDQYECVLTPMVRETLESTAQNRSQRYNYTVSEWERGETHDQTWNEIQLELVANGRELMNDRVYWCDKLIAYQNSPADAFRLAIYLNDKYMLDALDPVGYKNIAECFNLACLTSGELNKTFEKNPIRTILKNALDACGVDKTRVRVLNDLGARAKKRKAKGGAGGEYVLYIANGAFRKRHNEAYELAKALANMSSLPLVYLAVISLNHFQRGSIRQIQFVLDGLVELEKEVAEDGVAFCFRFESASELPTAENLIGDDDDKTVGFESRAWAIITDRAHLRANREMVKKAAFESGCAMIEVETNLSVPLEKACAGFAPDFDSFYERFLPLARKYAKPAISQDIKVPATVESIGAAELGKVYPFMNGKAWTVEQWLQNRPALKQFLEDNRVDVTVPPVSGWSGGESNARKLMDGFVNEKLRGYASAAEEYGESNRIGYGSGLSPYLCYGFISAQEILAQVFQIANSDQTKVSSEDISAFLQNMARREMAFNFVHYSEKYDVYEGVLSNIVRKTLEEAGKKRKNYDYSLHVWESGETHDEKWNAVQKMLYNEGRHMSQDRSFWCQKIIEYNRDPRKAYQIALSLNERLMIDAMDAVSYRNIAESFKLASLLVSPQTAVVARPVPQNNMSDKTTMKALVKAALEDCGVERSRVRLLNDLGPRRAVNDSGTSEYVLYWMTSAFRSEHNESLEVAKILANNAGLPLVVLVLLDLTTFALSSKTHILYWLSGIAQLSQSLEDQGIRLAFRVDPTENYGGGSAASVVGMENSNIIGFASRAWAVVTDRSHLRIQRASAKKVAAYAGCSVVEVESRLMVPLELAERDSPTLEAYSERFFSLLGQFVKKLNMNEVNIKAKNRKLKLDLLGFQWDFMRGVSQWGVGAWLDNHQVMDTVLTESGIDLSCVMDPQVGRGGESEAKRILQSLVDSKLHEVGPESHILMNSLQAQICFGFISPIALLETLTQASIEPNDLRSFLWKMVKIEYSVYRVYFNPAYDEYASCVDPQRRSALEYMKAEMMGVVMPSHALDAGETPDTAWNSVQISLRETGSFPLHSFENWVFGVLRLSYSPQEAFVRCLDMVRRYALEFHGALVYNAVLDVFNKLEVDTPAAGENKLAYAARDARQMQAGGGGVAGGGGWAGQRYSEPVATGRPMMANGNMGMNGMATHPHDGRDDHYYPGMPQAMPPNGGVPAGMVPMYGMPQYAHQSYPQAPAMDIGRKMAPSQGMAAGMQGGYRYQYPGAQMMQQQVGMGMHRMMPSRPRYQSRYSAGYMARGPYGSKSMMPPGY